MTLDANSPEIRDFVAAYEANQKVAGHLTQQHVRAEDHRKYIYIDEIDNGAQYGSGRFMIDRETGYVYTIKGYGKRGHLIGHSVTKMADDYRAATATYDPSLKFHSQGGYSKVNSNRTPLRVVQGGRERRKADGLLRTKSRAARRRGQR